MIIARSYYMKYCKLQIGCILIVLYIIYNYYKGKSTYHILNKITLFDGMLLASVVCILFDGITAYTVNHLESINHMLNLFFHLLFLSSIDVLVFLMFLYLYRASDYGEMSNKARLIIFTPFILNLFVLVLGIPSLEFRIGVNTNYSMGISAYTCFAMVIVYTFLMIVTVFRRWNNLPRRKRSSIMTCLLMMISVMIYQAIYPESLITSIVPTMTILGAYINEEDPAMKQLSRSHEEMVMGFATLVESRDNSTGGHVKRTARYVEILTNALLKQGYYSDILSKDYVNNMILAAPMHDIGKIAVPDEILQKPGKLTDEEYEMMKTHSLKGGDILKETFARMGNTEYLEIAYEIATYHHEKWNGRGYPFGLKKKEIPLCARIMAIADVFDACSANRCYRPALPLEKCFSIIAEGSGNDFEPLLTEVFLSVKDEIIRAQIAFSETENRNVV